MARSFFGNFGKRAYQRLPTKTVEPVTTTTTPVETDSTPDAFTFLDITGAVFGSTQTSNTIAVSGLSDGVFVSASISGDATSELQKNDNPWQTSSVSVQNGDTLTVRHTAAFSVNTTLTVGGVSDTFTSTTVVSSTAGQPTGLLLAITKAA